MRSRKISRGPPEFMHLIHRVAELSEIKEFDYAIQFGCDDVDDYTNGMYKVNIRGLRDGQKIRKKYIVKWHSEPHERTIFRDSYRREVLFYQKIVPKLLQVQRSFQLIEGLKMKFPNCDFASAELNKEALVICDPQYEGFRFYSRLHKLDLNHVSLVVKNLAKWHALSFVLEKSQPSEFEEIKLSCSKDIQYQGKNRVPKSMASFYNASVNVVKDTEARKKLHELAPNIMCLLNKCAMPSFSEYLTLCHGDCWNNNVLFKYQNGNPVDVIFVDCQLIRYASPVTDISYYLYMSTDEQFLVENYDRVIMLYYKTLSAVLRQCEMDCNTIYPESVFREHLRMYSVYGLIESLIAMKIITAEIDDALKMTEVKYEFSEEGTYLNEQLNKNHYVDRVNGVVNDFFSRKYSLDTVLVN